MVGKDTLYGEEENKRKSFIISLILHLLILITFLLPLIAIPEVKDSGGIIISFGNPDAGRNDAEAESIKPPSAAPSASSPSNVSADNIASPTKDDEAPVKASDKEKVKKNETKAEVNKNVEKDKMAQAKAKEEADRKNREAEAKVKAEKEAAEKAELANQKKKYSDLLGKGKGDTGQSGNQGSEKGNPDGKELEGMSKGSGKVGGGLSGRGIEYEPKFADSSQKTGRVALNICVNSEGRVTKADFTQKGSTTSDGYLIDLARNTALKYRFSKSEIDSQCGTVTVDFKVQ